MAHFCELDENGKVLKVVVVDNADCIKDSMKVEHPGVALDIRSVSGDTISKEDTIVEWEDEAKGVTFCENLLGGRWVQTSYNNNIRRRYAGIGYTYDKDRDAFIAPQPYKSWSLDKESDWQPPTPRPDDDKLYSWDEDKLEWVVEERVALIEEILGLVEG